MGNACIPTEDEGNETDHVDEEEKLTIKEPIICNNKIYYAVPENKPSIRAAYEVFCSSKTKPGLADPNNCKRISKDEISNINIGIIGCGVAGLYSALLLKNLGFKKITILETDKTRIGGRIYTKRFTDEPNQYFEAGAMRLPQVPAHQPVFDLVNYLNENMENKEDQVELISYTYGHEGNFVFVNGQYQDPKQKILMSKNYAKKNVDKLGFDRSATNGKTSSQLMNEAFGDLVQKLKKDFDKGFKELLKYDDYSFYTYLRQIKGWSHDKIQYVEVMNSTSNSYQKGFIESILIFADFGGNDEWKTIKNGMDRLPNAMSKLVGINNIKMGCDVYKITVNNDKNECIQVFYKEMIDEKDNEYVEKSLVFDKLICAIPPAALRRIQTPQWGVRKMQAIRTFKMKPVYKIGLRFKSRFWESNESKLFNPSFGGQSTTDLPSAWIVYPSYGIGDKNEGVLLLYCQSTDAYIHGAMTETERIEIGLRDLQIVYSDINIKDEFIEGVSINWAQSDATGFASLLPGQFSHIYNVAKKPEGNIFFAGEHLSTHHGWIVGAIDSALNACSQIVGSQLEPMIPKNKNKDTFNTKHNYDYSKCI
eukprot:313720_1